jgi:hypothetical protein
MLFLVENENSDFKVTHFPSREAVAKYIKNNPGLSLENYVLFEGEIQQHKDRHIYDGRFQ